jgi:hypothetical protein
MDEDCVRNQRHADEGIVTGESFLLHGYSAIPVE